jgi:hypothetical protein
MITNDRYVLTLAFWEYFGNKACVFTWTLGDY